MWSILGLSVLWYGLAASNQLLTGHLRLDYQLVPWCVLSTSVLVYGFSWLQPLLPRAWKIGQPASPVPRAKSRTVQVQYREEGCAAEADDCSATDGGVEQLEGRQAESVALLHPTDAAASYEGASESPAPVPLSAPPSPELWSLSGLGLNTTKVDGLSTDNLALLAAAALHVFYHCGSLYAALWTGDSAAVLLWRSWEPLLLHVMRARQVTLLAALQGAVLLYLLVRWDAPADSGDVVVWLMQRGLVVLSSAALCCCNLLLSNRWQSGESGRSIFLRVATYGLVLSVALWAVSLPVGAPIESLTHAVQLAFPLLSLSTALSFFVGWLLLTHCSLELYSVLLIAQRGLVLSGAQLLLAWRLLQALAIVASVTASSLIECCKLSAQRRWSVLPLLLVCATALVQRAFELPRSYAVLPVLPIAHQAARHIAVISAAGNGNLGDNAQIDAWRSHLDAWTERSGVPVVLHSWSRELCCSSYDETLKHFLPSDPLRLTQLLKETPALDWIWIGGGGLLSCPHPPLNDADPAWQYHLLQRAEISRTRVAFMGVGAREPELVGLVHPLIESAAYIGLRDSLSMEIVADAHVNRTQLSFMHDPVLAMLPVVPSPGRDSPHVPTCWVLMGDWQLSPAISLLVDSFFQPGEDLLITMEAKDGNFYGRFNPDFVRLHDRDLRSFAASLSHCDFVVSMRFHGTIIASQLGIPTLGIDVTSNHSQPGKMSVLYSPFELDRPDCVMYPNTRNWTFVEVKAMHNKCRRHPGAREHLQKRMAVIRADFQQQFDIVMDM